ncbi:MAG: ribosome maturation factor RimM [Methylococcales symbiont of Iophon sp. n. MRB-2018]|nr:MAG: ribosome maturation factor RimM [Methylococcales symbiont of Iophon sp. n. MRB-2018]KAF3980038.1 MAG: ribosome maturation factor RimM [Methylococcales symbiont of Iophon sp. n. MRB-2018]
MSEIILLNVGEIYGVFGIKGWVKIYSLTEPRENILNYSPWILKKGNETKQVNVLSGKKQGKTVVACLETFTDRDIAKSYSGWEILINKDQLPKTAEGEYYWTDLVGLKVETETGFALGIVDYLLETGANDVLVVKEGETERLIPFLLEQTVKNIDLENKLMIVDWDPDF